MDLSQASAERLQSFADRVEAYAEENRQEEWGAALLGRVQSYRGAPGRNRDGLSTRLMEAYKLTGSKEAFALLYELNHEDFLRLIYHHLRRAYYSVDAADILQEVFFNVYRYPFKFKPDRTSAFRNWTHSIIRNTVLKHSRRAQRDRVLSISNSERGAGDLPAIDPADERVPNPLDHTVELEAAEELVGSWMLYLHFYLDAYRCLTPREKRVLYLVEVDGLPYRDAAEKVEVRVENLKMMVFRARRKIFTIMKRKFQASQNAMDRRAMRTHAAAKASNVVGGGKAS